ncbi:MAG: hypothetical protein JKY93_03575 [Gammaproteobacteria bacterium]|nr:hypothetical protein [Gammaproteobacteria bacterium]
MPGNDNNTLTISEKILVYAKTHPQVCVPSDSLISVCTKAKFFDDYLIDYERSYAEKVNLKATLEKYKLRCSVLIMALACLILAGL